MAKGYGKRPLWQWILIYIVIGGLIYGAVYFLFLKPKSSTSGSSSSSSSQYSY